MGLLIDVLKSVSDKQHEIDKLFGTENSDMGLNVGDVFDRMYDICGVPRSGSRFSRDYIWDMEMEFLMDGTTTKEELIRELEIYTRAEHGGEN